MDGWIIPRQKKDRYGAFLTPSSQKKKGNKWEVIRADSFGKRKRKMAAKIKLKEDSSGSNSNSSFQQRRGVVVGGRLKRRSK